MARQKLTFKPTYEDYLAVSRAAMFNTATIVLLVLMGIMSALTILALAVGWLSFQSNQLLLYLLPPGTFIFFLIYNPIDIRRKARQSAEGDAKTSWQVTKNGITVTQGEETTKYPWESLAYAQELPEQYIIIIKANRSTYIFITKTAFNNSEEENEFRETVEGHLGTIKVQKTI
jgi:hypothetical protein